MRKPLIFSAIILSALLMLASCSRSSSAASSMASYGQSTHTAAKSPSVNGLAAPDRATASSQLVGQTKSQAPKLPDNSARKIVQSAEMSLTTDTYDSAVSQLEQTVANFGGFVQNSTTQGDGTSEKRTASFTVRVPSAQFEAFLDSVGNVGKVMSRTVTGDDVTDQYIDTETRLSALRTEEARLETLMKQATDMTDIINIEDKLTSVETQIEQYTGELKQWDALVDMSTVSVTLKEVPSGTAVKSDNFSGEVSEVFSGSINALVMTGRFICYAVVAVLPFAVIVGIIVAVVLLVRRRQRRRKPLGEHLDEPSDGKKSGEDKKGE